MSESRSHPGFTLVEMIVVLAILGVLAGVVGLAASVARTVRAVDEPTALIAAARREALRTRRPVTVSVLIDDARYCATALPDGSVVADSAFAIDHLTGRLVGAR